jgi:hypothetical protein
MLAERAKEIVHLNARLLAMQQKKLAEIAALRYLGKVDQERQKNKQRQLEQQVATLTAEAANAASELNLTKSSLMVNFRIQKSSTKEVGNSRHVDFWEV